MRHFEHVFYMFLIQSLPFCYSLHVLCYLVGMVCKLHCVRINRSGDIGKNRLFKFVASYFFKSGGTVPVELHVDASQVERDTKREPLASLSARLDARSVSPVRSPVLPHGARDGAQT